MDVEPEIVVLSGFGQITLSCLLRPQPFYFFNSAENYSTPAKGLC